MAFNLKSVGFGIFIVLVLFLSYHYLIEGYFFPQFYYGAPEEKKIEYWQRIDIKDAPNLFCLHKVVQAIEEKVYSDVYQEKPEENIFLTESKIEFILHTPNDEPIAELQLTNGSSILYQDVTFNGQPIELNKKEGEFCNFEARANEFLQKQGMNILGEPKCEKGQYYFLPSIMIKGDGKVNILKMNYKLQRSMRSDAPLKVPLFFKEVSYVKYFFLPPPPTILISSDYNSAWLYLNFHLNSEYYTILEKESGWMSLYKGFIGDKGVIAYKPLQNQKKKFEGNIFSSSVETSIENPTCHFGIILIPNLKIFLFPLIFLWVPIIFNFIKKKYNLFQRILYCYISLLILIGISNLPDLLKTGVMIYKLFYFFEIWFVIFLYLFPLLYSIIFYKMRTNQK